ncbi:MAG: hypothetical protein OEW15_16400 [Nitrospirota bacterium]|nr:hypothetical protein [Nitrospirota bacterium]
MRLSHRIIILLFLLIVSRLGITATNPTFEIYLTENKTDNLHKAILNKKPIITAADIISYDWNKHEIVLTDAGKRKLPTVEDIGVHGRSFIVVANGVRCYMGAFWTSLSSFDHPDTVINIGPYWDNRPANIIRIERAYPSDKIAKGADKRNNRMIYEALSGLNKIIPKMDQIRISK